MIVEIMDAVIYSYDKKTNKAIASNSIEYYIPFQEWITKAIKTLKMPYQNNYTKKFNDSSKLKEEYSEIAYKILYRINTNLDLNQGDFAFVKCFIDKKEYIIGLKLDYVPSYMLHMEDTNLLFGRNSKTYATTIKELFIFDVAEKIIRVKEKLVEINGKKERYISEYALEIEEIRKNDFDEFKTFLKCLTKLEKENELSIRDQIRNRKTILNEMQNRKEITISELINLVSNDLISKDTLIDLLEKKKITLEDSITLNSKIIDCVYKVKFYNEAGINVNLPLLFVEQINEQVEIIETENQNNVIIKNTFLK